MNNFLIPSSNEYENERKNKNLQLDFRPKLIYHPKNITELKEIYNFVQSYQLEFSIRSGGHCVIGNSNTNGVLIDLKFLNSIKLEKNTVIIGPGACLGDIYFFLEKQNKTITGGTCRSVAIGGQSLVGGIGYLTRKYGLMIDNIVRYQVLLKNQQLVNASATENSDLFWALRGFGTFNHFGVVTEIELKTFPTERVFVLKEKFPFSEKKLLSWLCMVKNDYNSTFQAIIYHNCFEISAMIFGSIPNCPIDKKLFKNVSFNEALELLTYDTKQEFKQFRSRMFSTMDEELINLLIKSAIKYKNFSVGIHQLRGFSETSVPWKSSKLWIDFSFCSDTYLKQNKIDSIYRKAKFYSDPYSYSGTADKQENFFKENENKLTEIFEIYTQ